MWVVVVWWVVFHWHQNNLVPTRQQLIHLTHHTQVCSGYPDCPGGGGRGGGWGRGVFCVYEELETSETSRYLCPLCIVYGKGLENGPIAEGSAISFSRSKAESKVSSLRKAKLLSAERG